MPRSLLLLAASSLLALISSGVAAGTDDLQKSLDADASRAAIATPASDIRPTWTPDDRLQLWGTLDAEGRHEIVEQTREGEGWGEARRSSLNAGSASDAIKDFDPVVLPDGSAAIFFSDRPGGLGGTDLWIAPRAGDGWGAAQPLPAPINSSADEWSPSISPDGRHLLFSSDRVRPGGPHRLYLAKRDRRGGWKAPRHVQGGDTERYAFDPCWIGNQGWIAYSRSPDPGQGSELVRARLDRGAARLSDVEPMPEPFNNASGWAFGCAWNPRETSRLYVSTVLGPNAQRLDVHALPLPADVAAGFRHSR